MGCVPEVAVTRCVPEVADRHPVCPQGSRWRARAQSFQLLCSRTCHLHSRLVSTAGRALLYDLHPYLWDIRNMLLAASAFVLWLGRWLMAALPAPVTAVTPCHTSPKPAVSPWAHPLLVLRGFAASPLRR